MSVEQSSTSSRFISDNASASGSAVTFVTGSTVWGPGALTGKLLKAVGEAGLDMVVNGIIRRRLYSIKRTFDKHPEIFSDPASVESEELYEISRDLHELRRDYYSQRTRENATELLRLMIIHQALSTIRRTLDARPRIFLTPQSDAEQEESDQIYEDLEELCRERYSGYVKTTAAELVGIIARLGDTQTSKTPNIRLILERDIMPNENRWKDLERVITIRSHYRLDGIGRTVTAETLPMSDIQVGKITEFKAPDVRTRSVILEENAMRHWQYVYEGSTW